MKKAFLIIFISTNPAVAAEVAPPSAWGRNAPYGVEAGGGVALHGFAQAGFSARTSGLEPSKNAGDYLLGEERLQISLSGSAPSGAGSFAAKADFFHDAVGDVNGTEVREAYVDATAGTADLRMGRQIITWGTGDLLFINDLFPKDWTALFSGRPLEYLKVGVDGLKADLYPGGFGIEAVAVPFFEPDRLPPSDRFFLFDPFAQVTQRTVAEPRSDAQNAEGALRLSRPFGSWDAALYAYRGFYRSPAPVPDNSASPTSLTFQYPRLAAYGFSLRGSGLGGVVNAEAGYHDSRQDKKGSDSLVPNSQALYLLGYQRQLGVDLTAGLQYYGEFMMRHARYRSGLPAGFPARDELRQLLTIRLTQFLKYQTWRLSLFGYWSPTDEDYYVIPEVRHDLSDGLWAALGGNAFGGRRDTTFFGQFDKNNNVYVTLRYEF